MSAPIAKWICSELSNLLGFEASDDIAEYILAIEDATDLKDYLSDLLDYSVPKNKHFIDELLRKWRPQGTSVGTSNNVSVQVYQKSTEATYFSGTTEKQTKGKKKGKKSAHTEQEPSAPVTNGIAASAPKGQHKSIPNDVKKKTKYVSLFNDHGDDRTVAILPGRHKCDCQAAKHTLVNNCVQCGRVVCDQEGSGPCLFCGALVCTKAEQEVLDRGSRKSEKLRQQLMDRDDGRSAYERAVEHKNKLLNYDKTTIQRTQVIDDESDYFSTDTNQWLSNNQREALRKREEELRSMRHASRKDRKVTLDFAGRRVIEEDDAVDMYNRNDVVVQQVHYGKGAKPKPVEPTFTEDDFGELVNPLIKQEPPKFVETVPANSAKPPAKTGGATVPKPRSVRIQDEALQKMSDEGVCLSMHQPWAALLVAGIKKHEGRTWYSSHRGRLWIAATAQVPTQVDIGELEASYRAMYYDDLLPFPKDYPVSCLLGCVNVSDVLDSDTYAEQYPDGESGSPYVFICDNPQQLIVKFPIRGKHKIYKLPHHIHQAGKKGLRAS